jgi:hypothetical protein
MGTFLRILLSPSLLSPPPSFSIYLFGHLSILSLLFLLMMMAIWSKQCDTRCCSGCLFVFLFFFLRVFVRSLMMMMMMMMMIYGFAVAGGEGGGGIKSL